MKAALGFTARVLVCVATTATADECHDACADVQRSVSFRFACSPFRNSLPRPKIARFCQEGFRTAVETNCYDACLNGGRLASYLTEIRLDESCERSLKQTPRPLCHDACVRGYRSGVQDMTLDLVKRMAEVPLEAFSSIRTTFGANQAAHNAHIIATADIASGEESTQEEIPPNALFAELEASIGPEAVTKYPSGGSREATESTASLRGDSPGVELANRDDAKLPLSVNEIGIDSDDRTNIFSDVNDEDESTDADAEDGPVLSVPITVDGVEEELMISDGEDPSEAVGLFCAEHMPEEGHGCVEKLLRVVQDEVLNHQPRLKAEST